MTVKIYCDSEPKTYNRKLIKEYLLKKYPLQTKSYRDHFTVLCLPGEELKEIYEIYDPISILRKNIYAFERNESSYQKIKKCRGINKFYGDLYGSLMNQNDLREKLQKIKFNFIYLDFCGTFTPKLYQQVASLTPLLKNGGSIGFSCLMQREKDVQFRSETVMWNKIFDEYHKSDLKIMQYADWYLDDLILNLPALYTIYGERVADRLRDRPRFNYSSPELTKHVRKHGFYPAGHLFTRYKNPNSRNMATVIFKLNSCKKIGKFRFNEKLIGKIAEKVYSKESIESIININHEPINRKTMVNSKIKEKMPKEGVIEFLKEFKDKKDLPDISHLTGYSVNQLRAIKAHITMGTYN